jgi:hypothetical protein
MSKKVLLLITVSLIFILFSCKKNQTGGNATVKGLVTHHGKAIPNAYVYIKFNATEFPGDDYKLYDTFVETDTDGNYSIALYKGGYYLYAKGYDVDIPSPYIVSGGLSVSVRNKENLSRDIAVTEGD